MKLKRICIFILTVILSILFSIYLYLETNSLKVSYYDISSEKLSKNFNNFKIAHISDFHNTKLKKLRQKLIKELEEENPNIIVITGDLIDSRKTNIDSAITFIESIVDIAPIYYVNGNHESRVKEYTQLEKKLIDLNVNILRNETLKIEKNTETMNIIGIDDPCFNKKCKPYDISNDLEKIMYGLNDDEYKILLSHRPEYFESFVDKNIDLVLSGHTHGGQIRFPFIGGIYAPNQGFNPKYISGLYQKENTSMIISRGIGNSGIPFRILNKPELVLVTLNSNK